MEVPKNWSLNECQTALGHAGMILKYAFQDPSPIVIRLGLRSRNLCFLILLGGLDKLLDWRALGEGKCQGALFHNQKVCVGQGLDVSNGLCFLQTHLAFVMGLFLARIYIYIYTHFW
jgi:hypothetical protein